MDSLVGEINEAGVKLARAGGPNVHVFGSIGPAARTGLEERAAVAGDVAGWSGQALYLVDAGAEAIVLETFTEVDELARAVSLLSVLGLPVIASMTIVEAFDAACAAHHLELAGASAIGLNCMPPDEMLPLCRKLRKATRMPLWMKPSAGLPRKDDEGLVYDMSPEHFADGAMALVDAGADFIGGCCGAGPAHIGAVAERLRRRA
jgi:methionine synthase I (cobalamin-dependent)